MSDIPYLSRSVLISAFLLGLGGLTGYLAAMADPASGQVLLEFFKEMVADEIMSHDPPVVAFELFLNNLQACLLLFLGGATFGLLTTFILLFNGLIIGAILQVVRTEAGSVMILAAIIPHGIFEIPAVIVSGAFGLLVGKAIREEFMGTRDASAEAYRLGRLFLRYVVPFVAFAACIEAFITPAVLQMVA